MSVRVVFEVSCPTANFDEICLVGSCPELGAWDSTRAVPLRTSDKSYPVWRSGELMLPKAYEVVQYKYIKVCGGAVAQWELGPHRVMEFGRLLDNVVNYVSDVAMSDAAMDVDDYVVRRTNSGARIRFHDSGCLGSEFLGPAKSQMTSLVTSRLASSIPSPLRSSAGPTPVEKNHMQELEVILRGLVELEPMNLVGCAHVRRAIIAVRSAIEAERNRGPYHMVQRRCTGRTCAVLSLVMVPLLPVIVATAVLWHVPSARQQKPSPSLVETRNQFRWPWVREAPPAAFCSASATAAVRRASPRPLALSKAVRLRRRQWQQ